MRKKRTVLAGGFEDLRRSGRIIKNNALLVRGLGLTMAIFVASDLKSALIVSLGLSLLTVFTHFICYFIAEGIPYRLKMMTYALVCALLYIPTLMLLSYIFGSLMRTVLPFLPMMAADTMVLSESERVRRETFSDMLANSLSLAVGFSGVTVLLGAFREFISKGTLWDTEIIQLKLLPLFSTPIGGFISLAVLSAALQAFLNLYKKTLIRRQNRID